MINKLNKKIDDWLNKGNKKGIVLLLALIVLILISMSFVDTIMFENNIPKIVSIEEFYSDLKAGNIDTIYYNATEETMRYTVLNNETREMTMTERLNYNYPKENWRQSIYPGNAEADFRREMTENYHVNVKVRSFKPALSTMWDFILTVLMMLATISFMLIFMMRHMTPEKKFNSVSTKIDTKFKDIIGQDEVLKDLEFIVDMLQGKKKADKFGARVPKGILLSGPPGTGKTLIARAIAGEAGVPFFSANASEFIDLYVGMGARAVRSLFNQARKNKPCIIFIDEIDAIASKRGATGSTSEDSKTVNALLQEMDGFNKDSGVFIIAATNNADSLDEAIVRAGRFDRQVIVNPPRDWKTRNKLFDKYIGDVDCTANIENISRQTVGFTGADIDMVVNEAKLTASMMDKEALDDECFEIAIDKKVFKSNRSKSEKINRDIKIAAYHEAGHAVMTYLANLPIARASIIGSTSGVGGVVFQADKKDASQFTTKSEYEWQIKIAYAGRAAEEIIFKDVSDGASSDITQATNLIYMYICRVGMDANFGMLDMELLKNIDPLIMPIDSMKEMSAKLMKETVEILSQNINKIKKVAEQLLEKETLSGEDIEEIIKQVKD